MAITKPTRPLPFPKGEYNKKINGQTKFTSTTETFTLEATAQYDSLHGAQLQYLPARVQDAVGQVITNPTVTCLTDSTTRTVKFVSPTGTEPLASEVYIDLYTGIIQFNSADAAKQFEVNYYKKASLISHTDMNRIWEAGATYIVGDSAHHDFSDFQDALTACSNYDSIKLAKDITTTGVTNTKKIKIIGNNKKITKSGSVTSSRAISTSEDLIIEDVDFINWDEAGDICIFASADIRAIITKNKAIGCTKLTNASTVCTHSIVENNLPFSENVGQATTVVTNNIGDKLVKQLIANGAVSVADPIFLDLADPTKCKKLTTVSSSDIFLGFADNAVSSGGTVNIVISGVSTAFSGLTAGSEYFLKTDGTIGLTATTSIMSVGKALSTGSINVDPVRTRQYLSTIITGTFTKGNAVWIDTSGAFSATNLTNLKTFFGVANNTATSGFVEVILSGIVNIPSYSLTIGGYLYVKNTDGVISQTNNKNVAFSSGVFSTHRLGRAISTTSFILDVKPNIMHSSGLVSGSITTNATSFADFNDHRYSFWSGIKNPNCLMRFSLLGGTSNNVLDFTGVTAGTTISFELRAVEDASTRGSYDVLGKADYRCPVAGTHSIDLSNLNIIFDSALINSSRTLLCLYWTTTGFGSGSLSFSTNTMLVKQEI